MSAAANAGRSPVPTFLIATLKVRNFPEYMERYGMPALAQLQAAGAQIEVGSLDPVVLEGTWDCNWTVVIRFANRAAAEDFYRSPGYAPLLHLRKTELTDGGSVILVDGFDPAAASG
ncbi:DUF1330 domain-containing protein [Zavarzinia sp. CC-PAN008]|uniref:DUF1330 domain-containing protein n=1 Tax=Zavarzinia sp. CC-PAN008 TaxID=3243332 RepID=UPI003F745CBA